MKVGVRTTFLDVIVDLNHIAINPEKERGERYVFHRKHSSGTLQREVEENWADGLTQRGRDDSELDRDRRDNVNIGLQYANHCLDIMDTQTKVRQL